MFQKRIVSAETIRGNTVLKKYYVKDNTLDSGIDVAPGINIAPGTSGKNIKRSP